MTEPVALATRTRRAPKAAGMAAILLVGAFLGLAAIPGTANAGSCGDPYYSPTAWGPPSTAANFTYGLGVSVRYELFIYDFTAKYSWDATTYDLGGGAVFSPEGGSIFFHSTEILPAKEGNYSISGRYNGTLRAPDGTVSSFKCRYGPLPFETLSYKPYVRPAVVVTATPTSGNVPLNVSFDAVVSGGSAPYAYQWSFGDGTSGTGPTPSHTYTVPLTNGVYSASVTVTDGRSNSTTGTVEIAATAQLRVGATSSRQSGTAPLTVFFNASAFYGTSPYSYAWSFGDGSTATGPDVSHTYASPGTYQAVVNVTDSGPTPETASASIGITVSSTAPLSVAASAQPTSGTAPASVSFQATVSGGAAPYVFAWTFGDGGTSSDQNPTHTFASAGIYDVTVQARDANGASASTSLAVTVAAPPATLSASAAASVASGTAPLTVSFTGDASGGTVPYSFAWDFGDGTTSTEQNPTHVYASAGTFNVTMHVTDAGGGTAVRALSVTVHALAATGAGPLSPSAVAVVGGAAVVIAIGVGGALLAWRRSRVHRAPPRDEDHQSRDRPRSR